jgi:hypothetical protein
MNTSTHEPLDAVMADLIRRGLPAEYAQRAASELTDHHRDLVEELQVAGWTASHAVSEASRRLGDPRALVKKTVREYQFRYWCGRWPLLTFFLGPVPGLLVVWLITGLTLAGIGWILELVIEDSTASEIEPVGQYVVGYAFKFWLTLASPVLVMAMFCWLASRAAMSRAWPWVAAGMMATFIGFVPCKIDFKTATNPTGHFMIGYHPWFLPENFNGRLLNFFTLDIWQLSQLIVPLLVTAICMVCFRMQARNLRQLASRVS